MRSGASRRRVICLALLLHAVFLGTMASADEPAPAAGSDADLGDLSLEQLMALRVVTASKYEQRQSETPASVTIVTEQDIQHFGFRTLADVLRSVRGFYVSDSREYSYLGVRGFSLPRDFNTRVLVLVNGQRVNDPIYAQVGIGLDFPVDMAWVKRIEVVRGPSSSLYGNSAFFAVVNVITLQGDDVNAARAAGTLGSLGTEGATAGYGGRLGGVEVLAAGTSLTADGERSVFARQFASPDTQDGYAHDADGEWYERGLLQARLGDLSLSAFASRDRDHIPLPRFGTIFGDPAFTYDETWISGGLAYRHVFGERSAGEGSSIEGRVYVMHYGFGGRYPFDYGDDLPRVINRDQQGATWWGGELQGSASLWKELRLTSGVEVRHTFDLTQKNFDDLPERVFYVDTHGTEVVAGGYLQLDWEPIEWLTLSAGGRYDFISEDSQQSVHFDGTSDHLSPRAGAVVRPADGTDLKLLYGEAFRAPNNFERFYTGGDPSIGSADLFNPSLKPETVRTVELVGEQQFGEHWRVLASGYYYRTDHLILDTIVDDKGNAQYQNFPGVEGRGFELEIDARWPRLLQGRLSYGLQRADSSDSGGELSNSPTNLIQGQLALPLHGEQLVVALDMHALTERKLDATHDVPGYVIGDLTVSSAGLVDGLHLSTSIHDLADTAYTDPFPGTDVPETPQIGRTFWFTAQYDYAL